jgi:lysophospholipase L1-like esterase
VAQGIGASSPQKSYVGRLVKSLERKTGRQVRVTNLSVSGARVEDVLRDQLPKLKRMTLDSDSIVTIDIGANNMGEDFDIQKFETGMREILHALPKQTVVADVPYFGNGFKRKLEPHVTQANEKLVSLLAEVGLRRAKVHEATMVGGFRSVAGDFFHPSDYGYDQWFSAFWSVLDT